MVMVSILLIVSSQELEYTYSAIIMSQEVVLTVQDLQDLDMTGFFLSLHTHQYALIS